jgi:hypothetical protein
VKNKRRLRDWRRAGANGAWRCSESVIPAPFGLELMAERKAGIQNAWILLDPRVKPEDDEGGCIS